MRRALIIGTGGHCRVLLSLLAACGKHEVMGIIDLAEPRVDEVIMGVRVIGSVTLLDAFCGCSDLDVFLAIGNNALRRTWWQKASDLGLALPNLVSPQAIVDPHANMGGANVVCAMAFIGPETSLGDNNLVNTAAVVEHEVRMGSHCHLAPSSSVAGRCRIGDGCFIGAGATVIQGIEVAASITVGAGSTVIRSIADPCGVYLGIPARRWVRHD